MKQYNALVVSEENGTFSQEFKSVDLKDLKENEVLIKTHYSSINYKDYLSSIGNKGVTRNYPHVPGIDAAGVVEKSRSSALSPGQEVLVTGYDLGMNTDGGWAQYVIVPSDWVVVLPDNLSLKNSMVLGTAGFTAAQCVEAIVKFSPEDDAVKKVIVSGASGGVGSVATKLLNHLGYSVTALTRSGTNVDFLKKIGAGEVLSIKDWEANLHPKKPLEKGIWQGAVDTVGGEMLANLLKCLSYRSVVSCCGMVGGVGLTTTVFPFILRGIKLIGIDSAEQPLVHKKNLWNKITNEWKLTDLSDLYQEIDFSELPENIHKMKHGEIQGRVIVKF